jgi:hypothetical protein
MKTYQAAMLIQPVRQRRLIKDIFVNAMFAAYTCDMYFLFIELMVKFSYLDYGVLIAIILECLLWLLFYNRLILLGTRAAFFRAPIFMN